ncbi:MAG: CoA transferase [Gemmatimonadetes bacterium]|nr:CoA transferase [Gemmatimonadota bacterium]
MADALAGLLVADFSESLAGPFCTQILADLGAEVVKVERPGAGDSARAWGPPFWGEDGAVFLAANRNKRSIALNLKDPAGLEVARRLVARADVMVQSFRAGVIESLGLGYEDVRRLNSRLVYCSVTAYGTVGPLKELPGYDPLMQAHSGLMSVTGLPGHGPVRVGTSIVDMGTALWAVVGILAALRERERTGQGSHVVTSLFESALMWMSYQLIGYLATGEVPGPQGTGLAMIAPYGAFPTSDGEVMIGAATDGLYRRMCDALDLRDLRADPRFADNPGRVRNRDELSERLAVATRRESTAGLLEKLRAAGVPCAPILRVDQVAADPQAAALGVILSAPHERIADYRCVALPLLRDGERPGVRRAPPRMGEHTRELLRELGFAEDKVRRLEADGVAVQG